MIEPEVGLAVAFAVPAAFLDGELRLKISGGVKIEAVGQRRIEKTFVMLEMVNVIHREHTRTGAAEDADERLVNLAKLHLQLVEQRQIILAQRGVAGEGPGDILQRAGNIYDDALPPELAFHHRLPVAREPFVARTFRPDIVKPFGLLLIPEQFGLVIRIAEVLDLQPLVFVQGAGAAG